jgi:hypothetical protein
MAGRTNYRRPYKPKDTEAEPVPEFAQPYFLDIETVHGCEPHELSEFTTFKWDPGIYDLYRTRNNRAIEELAAQQGLSKAEAIDRHYLQYAPLSAEFGKIVCISLGKVVKTDTGSIQLRIKALAGADEGALLNEFVRMILKARTLCAHNGKEFDYPFLFRRLVIQNIPVPGVLNTIGKKLYEMSNLEDTQVMWSGSQWNHRVGLDLLSNLFGLQSSKEEMTGADVWKVFYFEEGGLEKIARYGRGDIFNLVNIYNRLKGFNLILPEQVVYT